MIFMTVESKRSGAPDIFLRGKKKVDEVLTIRCRNNLQ